MRLLFEKGFAPTHAFSAFYRYLREDFAANAVLHFGTHGALEFMPGKQAGMSGSCWPDRLIADLPNFYLYASNNPSEGALAKRRAGATLISYLTPPVTKAGIYAGLVDLKTSIERWRAIAPEQRGDEEDHDLAALIQAQAAQMDLCKAEPLWNLDDDQFLQTQISKLYEDILELEYTLIPHGMHVVGTTPSESERVDLLSAMSEGAFGKPLPNSAITQLVQGKSIATIVSKNTDLKAFPKEEITQSLEKLQHGISKFSKRPRYLRY